MNGIDAQVSVASLGLAQEGLPLAFSAHAQRIRRLATGLARTLEGIGHRFEVAHLSRPVLAPAIRPFAGRVVVGAWFHPHALAPRIQETWRHTRGPLPRRAALTGRSVTYFAGDERGYRDADLAVALARILDRPRPEDLADRAEARFGAGAVGARLTELRAGSARVPAPAGRASPGAPIGSPPLPP